MVSFVVHNIVTSNANYEYTTGGVVYSSLNTAPPFVHHTSRVRANHKTKYVGMVYDHYENRRGAQTRQYSLRYAPSSGTGP